jgi:formylglycine-generating enzyme required for sulfatase activity
MNRVMRLFPALLVPALLLATFLIAFARQDKAPGRFENSLHMRMIRVPAGSFAMGNTRHTDPNMLGQSELFENGDYDEKPVHQVRISEDFYISETEVTTEQYQEFRMDYQDDGPFPGYATGVSWNEAVVFCEWLSQKEKRLYRLPTEAEWEYAARAGSTTHFPSGDMPPAPDERNKFGLLNMNSGPLEWTADWYGPYEASAQTDPVGPEHGFAKVVRGGGIQGPRNGKPETFVPYYRRSANRASVAPVYRGRHAIGFRVVAARKPQTAYTEESLPFARQFVKQKNLPVAAGPAPSRPWYHIRVMLPIPPENMNADAIVASGLDPGLNGHNHSNGATICQNGDVLLTGFSSTTSSTEYLPNTVFFISRLRFGAEEWDTPGVFWDFADANDQSALLYAEGNTIHFFGGGIGLDNVPFRWATSNDNGASWSEVTFPLLRGSVGGFSPQPITSAFRAKNGSLYLASDAVGGQSLLWETSDNGRTWSDTGGRTAGRHTAFVELKDGSILGMGGKNTNIDGYMPKAISKDGGKTWTVSKTPFPALGSNQRPTLLRLKSGRLFFAGDFEDPKGNKPAQVKGTGSYAALSEDEGKTWHIKQLPGVLPHESHSLPFRPGWKKDRGPWGTIGYAVAAQSQNGVIHLTTSMNHPSLDIEMNEAWILDPGAGETSVDPTRGRAVHGKETYPDGKTKVDWNGNILADGRFVLDGPEVWYSPTGVKRYEVTWNLGKKTKTETLWSPRGERVWEWERSAGGVSTWTQYWPVGRVRHVSHWVVPRAVGTAESWDIEGRSAGKWQFENGDLKR